MRVDQNQRVRLIEIHRSRDPAKRLGVVVREKTRQHRPRMEPARQRQPQHNPTGQAGFSALYRGGHGV